MKKLLLIIASITLTACSTQPKQLARLNDMPFVGKLYSNTINLGYEGEVKPIKDVAVLTREDGLYILSINGTKDFHNRKFGQSGYMYPTGANQLHLLPGLYKIEFCFSTTSGNFSASCLSPIIKEFNLIKEQRLFLTIEYPTSRTWNVVARELKKDEFSALEQDFNKHVLNKRY
jgi:hypothetical protein